MRCSATSRNRTWVTEQFRRKRIAEGDFSAALTDRIVQTDLGPIREGTIFDPLTTRTVNGQIVRDPFPGNMIPQNRLDPVALKVQSLIPTPNTAALVNNYIRQAQYRKIQDIPSIKVDHSFTGSSKMSFYYSRMRTDKDNGQDGLPDPISRRRDQIIRSHTTRVNFDQSISPDRAAAPRGGLPAISQSGCGSGQHSGVQCRAGTGAARYLRSRAFRASVRLAITSAALERRWSRHRPDEPQLISSGQADCCCQHHDDSRQSLL